MKSKLTIEHLAPYLPYRINPLKLKYADGILTLEGISGGWNLELRSGMLVAGNIHVETVIPYLRPMIELKTYQPYLDEYSEPENDIYYKGEDIIMDSNGDMTFDMKDTISWQPKFIQRTVNIMFKHHFDVFGLIQLGIAIDINTLPHAK